MRCSFGGYYLLFFLLAFPAVSWSQATPEIPLFNGRDLQGWVAMHGGEWVVKDGILVGRNGTNWTTNPEQSGSWLRTDKEYGNFVLQLDYSINTNGNSGIHFRSALNKNPSFTGYEMQIVDDFGREPRKSSSGAIYDVVAASRNMSKPAGEWNQVLISCRGDRIQVRMNGELIADHKGNRAKRGYIGLQNHDHKSVVRFRNIRMTDLGSVEAQLPDEQKDSHAR